jgi:hypothetical protein
MMANGWNAGILDEGWNNGVSKVLFAILGPIKNPIEARGKSDLC